MLSLFFSSMYSAGFLIVSRRKVQTQNDDPLRLTLILCGLSSKVVLFCLLCQTHPTGDEEEELGASWLVSGSSPWSAPTRHFQREAELQPSALSFHSKRLVWDGHLFFFYRVRLPLYCNKSHAVFCLFSLCKTLSDSVALLCIL